MTYENAVKWIIENMNLNFFKDYKDFWENGVSQDPSFSPKLLKHPRFVELLSKAVFKRKPEWTLKDLPLGAKIAKRVRTFQSIATLQREFTTRDTYQRNPFRPRASIRSELQELVKEGRLKRVKRGVYKVIRA